MSALRGSWKSSLGGETEAEKKEEKCPGSQGQLVAFLALSTLHSATGIWSGLKCWGSICSDPLLADNEDCQLSCT